MLYRIYTENLNRQYIVDIVKNYFSAFTIISASGYWRGISEPTAIIEIETDKTRYQDILDIAKKIKQVNSQEVVHVQRIIAMKPVLI